MMRGTIAVLGTGLMLAACGHRAPPPMLPAAALGHCDATALGPLRKTQASAVLASEALTASGARTIRWMRPHYRFAKSEPVYDTQVLEDRLTIMLDKHDRAKRFTCG